MSRPIVFIPVRGNSKSIPGKNIKLFYGKPLVYWVTKAAQDAANVDEVIVATDSAEIRLAVNGFGFNKVRVFDRSDENATDMASTESVMLEYLNSSDTLPDNQDLFILVQATSPFLKSIHLDEAIDQISSGEFDSLLSCVRMKRFFWDESGSPVNYDYQKRPRRQEFSGQFMENGAFYINTVGNLIKTGNRLGGRIGIYEMPTYTALELDEPDDWSLGEYFMHREQHKITKIKFNEIKLLLTDVDGVLTDSGMYYSETGDELKKFNTRDGKAFELLQKKGIKVGIITSEDTKLVERRARKLNVDYLYQGVKDKLAIVKDIIKKEGLTMDQVAYVGDDLNDLQVLKQVGLAVCPLDAVDEVQNMDNIFLLRKKGGEGAVRELSKFILEQL